MSTRERPIAVFALQEIGDCLLHKTMGEKARKMLEKTLKQTSAGTVVIIDCAGVDLFDASFAGSFLAKTVATLPVDFPDRALIVKGLDDDMRENLDPALTKLGLMMIELVGKQYQLRGHFSPTDQQTLALLHKQRKPFTVRELAESLSINVTAAHERLTKLAKMAVLWRQTAETGRAQQLFIAPAT